MDSKQPGADTEQWSIRSDHPLAIELSSLRSALAHYQNAAHSASIQLQGRALEASLTAEQCRRLEGANSALESELAVLRSHTFPTPPSSATQIAELTLALRRLNSRLSGTEATLERRIREGKELAAAKRRAEEEAMRLRNEVQALKEREKSISSREAAVLAKEKELFEERKLMDELANTITSRPSSRPSTPTETVFDSDDLSSTSKPPPYSFPQTRNAIVKLMREASSHSTRLEAQLTDTISTLEAREMELEAERQVAQGERERAAKAEAALEAAKADDRAAAGLVDRYMKFSQSTTDALHNTLSTLQKRHSATLSTLQTSAAQSAALLKAERRRADSFRRALDEVTKDIVVHAEGRRREIAIRLSLIAREEKWAGELRKWLGGANRQLRKLREAESLDHPAIVALEKLTQSAAEILGRVDGSLLLSQDLESTNSGFSDGSVARIIAAEEAVTAIISELQEETQVRLQLEKEIADRDIALQEKHHSNGHADPAEQLNDEGAALPSDMVPAVPDSHFVDEEEQLVDESNTGPQEQDLADLTSTSKDGLVDPTVTTTQDELHEVPPIDDPLPALVHPAEPPTLSTATVPDADTSSSEILQTVLNSPPALATTTFSAMDEVVDTSLSSTTINSGLQQNLDDPLNSVADEDSRIISVEDVSAASFPSLKRVDSDVSFLDKLEPGRPVDSDLSFLSKLEPSNGHAIGLGEEQDHYADSTVRTKDPELEDLLGRLTNVASRYDGLQQSFKGCHSSLSDLKTELVSLSISPETSTLPQDRAALLSVAVNRLDDITEDARVSLEIKIIDDARLAKGFETLLSIGGSETDRQRLIDDVEEFIAGEEGAGRPPALGFEKKLDDLQHDIAVIKSVVHDWMESSEESGTSQGSDAVASSPAPGWGWTTTFLPSRSASPALPTPTFGSVMSGTSSLKAKRSTSSLRLPGSSSPNLDQNPLAALGLRHSMPIHAPSSNQSGPPMFPQSRRGSAQLGLGLPLDRPGTPSLYFANLAPHFGLGSSSGRLGAEGGQRPPLRVVSAPHLSLSADDIE